MKQMTLQQNLSKKDNKCQSREEITTLDNTETKQSWEWKNFKIYNWLDVTVTFDGIKHNKKILARAMSKSKIKTVHQLTKRRSRCRTPW